MDRIESFLVFVADQEAHRVFARPFGRQRMVSVDWEWMFALTLVSLW